MECVVTEAKGKECFKAKLWSGSWYPMWQRGLMKSVPKKCPLWEEDHKLSKQKANNPIKINEGHKYRSITVK